MSSIEFKPSYIITISEEEAKVLYHLLAFNENRIRDSHQQIAPLYRQIKALMNGD